jgi:hypothetical protein
MLISHACSTQIAFLIEKKAPLFTPLKSTFRAGAAETLAARYSSLYPHRQP